MTGGVTTNAAVALWMLDWIRDRPSLLEKICVLRGSLLGHIVYGDLLGWIAGSATGRGAVQQFLEKRAANDGFHAPPILALKKPPPIIGMTTACAKNQSMSPQ
jgi:hypothetical protein